MYELVNGKHPLWEIEDDNRSRYKEKLKELRKIESDSTGVMR
jgi:hypothetical protein